MSRPADQSHLRHPITRLLGNSGNIRVLRALVAYGAPLAAVQLAREAGLTPQGTRLVLENLVAQGVVTVLGLPRSQVFALAPKHPFADLLKEIFLQEQNRWDGLQQALRDILQAHRSVRSAWLYGSVARGQDTPHSDVDIAIVAEDGSDAALAVREALQGLEDRFYVHFSVVGLTGADVARLSRGDAWWVAMSRDTKVLKGVSPDQEAARRKRKGLPA